MAKNGGKGNSSFGCKAKAAVNSAAIAAASVATAYSGNFDNAKTAGDAQRVRDSISRDRNSRGERHGDKYSEGGGGR